VRTYATDALERNPDSAPYFDRRSNTTADLRPHQPNVKDVTQIGSCDIEVALFLTHATFDWPSEA